VTGGPSLIDTLGWLVDIPSETGAEAAIGQALIDRLSDRNEPSDFTRVDQSFVVGRRTGRPLLLLVGHTDTVPSQGQGPAHVVDGRMHGLGTADMKGGLAVMVHLLEDEAVDAGPFDVIGVFYAAEEGPADRNQLEGVLTRVPWLAEATFAVVLEPCDREIQVGCNGVVNARLVFTGRSSHSARPWWGENAVTKAGEWLAKMHRRPPEPHVVDGLEYKEVMSVTRAHGGIANNIIPPRFEVTVNYRFAPDRTLEEAVAHLRAVCDAADAVEILDTAPAGPVDAGHPFVAALAEASGSRLTPKQGWTDVARLGMYGIAAVNFGPGSATQAHQAEEWVDLGDLEHAYRALRVVLAG
jgi:succinyl-diaminopimelate desuccinylase